MMLLMIAISEISIVLYGSDIRSAGGRRRDILLQCAL